MRRETRRRQENNGLDFRKVLYISGTVLAIAVIGFVITFFVYGNKMNEDTRLSRLNTTIVDEYLQNTEEASSQFGKTVNELSNDLIVDETDEEKTENDVTKYAVNTSKAEENVTSNTNKGTTTNVKENKDIVEEQKVKDPEFKMPVSGDILREYAKDKLVYSDTLGEWVTHNGIDIKAEKTTVVKSSAEGCIKSIKNDPRYGLTIVIEHVNGFKTIYSNLLTAEFVVVGENVKEGQTIGTVGNTATFEIADEPHLHFEIMKNGEYLDPELYIKK